MNAVDFHTLKSYVQTQSPLDPCKKKSWPHHHHGDGVSESWGVAVDVSLNCVLSLVHFFTIIFYFSVWMGGMRLSVCLSVWSFVFSVHTKPTICI